VKRPFFSPRKTPASLSDAEIDERIARYDAILDNRKTYSMACAVGAILITGAAVAATCLLSGGLMTLAATWGGIGLGLAASGGVVGACRGFLSHACTARNNLVDVYNGRIIAQQQAEIANAEAERLRRIKAAEDFNIAVESGLPLEQSITVKRPLKLKRAGPPTHHGFARIKDLFDLRF
jgi:hypothetical protein